VSGAAATAALVDIDGVLVDSNYQHIMAWHQAFLDHDRPVPATVLHRHIGLGSDMYVGAVTDDAFADEHGDGVLDAHARHFEALQDTIRAVPGAVEMIDALLEAELTVVLCSSAEPQEADHHLETLGLDAGRLAGVVTQDDVDRAKPAPDVFAAGLEKSGASASAALAIGDTVWDVKAAGRVGIPCLAVLTGGIARSELEEAGAAGVFEDPREIARDIEDVLRTLRVR
jgi:HAD superfamily hydrolase (TIGR01509 family)